MLTVGVDSYVTVEQATEYITAHYPSTDTRVTAWGNLEEADQEVFLRRACTALSELAYRGMTFEALQTLPFPRYLYPDGVMAYTELIAPLSYIYPELAEVPQDIMNAQIEEAFERACPSADSTKSKIKNGAVESVTIGHFSEHYSLAALGSVSTVLVSGKAQKLVAPYIGGAFDVL